MRSRRFAAFVLALTVFVCAGVRADGALTGQANGYAVASDGRDAYFLIARYDKGREDEPVWSIHSARRMLGGEPPMCELAGDTQPFGMLYADQKCVWYARYSKTIRFEQDRETYAALEFVRHELTTGKESVLVTDADPDALFPLDGRSLGYLPWGDGYTLATADFSKQTNRLTVRAEDSMIWDATMANGALYLLLYNEEFDREMLYRAAGGEAEKLRDPTPKPSVSWFQGRFRVYAAGEGALYASELERPALSRRIPMSERWDDGYTFGDYRWICEPELSGLSRLYRVPLTRYDRARYLEFVAPESFVRGASPQEMIVLDRRGRFLRVHADCTGFTQIAQLKRSLSFQSCEWLWALPFADYVVLLGYSDDYDPPPGLEYPPDTAIVTLRDLKAERDCPLPPAQAYPIPTRQ